MKNKVQTIHVQLNDTAAKKLQKLRGEEENSSSAIIRAAINLMYQSKGYEDITQKEFN